MLILLEKLFSPFKNLANLSVSGISSFYFPSSISLCKMIPLFLFHLFFDTVIYIGEQETCKIIETPSRNHVDLPTWSIFSTADTFLWCHSYCSTGSASKPQEMLASSEEKCISFQWLLPEMTSEFCLGFFCCWFFFFVVFPRIRQKKTHTQPSMWNEKFKTSCFSHRLPKTSNLHMWETPALKLMSQCWWLTFQLVFLKQRSLLPLSCNKVKTTSNKSAGQYVFCDYEHASGKILS